MSDTQLLLNRISALRRRLEQANGLARSAAQVVERHDAPEPLGGRVHRLEKQVQQGADHHALLSASLHEIHATPAPTLDVVPTQLTARARRALETAHEQFVKLRALGAEHGLEATADGEPTIASTALQSALYRDCLAMTELMLRTLQALPDQPSQQLRACEGMEGLQRLLQQRLDTLSRLLDNQRRELQQIDLLAQTLLALTRGQAVDPLVLRSLAMSLLHEAQEQAPIRFAWQPTERVAEHIAAHSLTVAQLMARLVLLDPELKGRPVEAILVGLVHDAGMLYLPADLLAQRSVFTPSQRREVEAHASLGAELVKKLYPEAPWLSAATASHHERLSGTGYPEGVKDDMLSSLTKLLAVCDVYAACCAPRPHRPAREPRSATAEILLLAEQGLLDRYYAQKLLQLGFYPVGSLVELTEGSVGVVVASPREFKDASAPAKPVLAILTDSAGKLLPTVKHLDLSACEGKRILRTLTQEEAQTMLGLHQPAWLTLRDTRQAA